MNAVIFDTHAFVKRLTAVGMPEAQAEVLADEQARLIDERLATKTDLQELELRLENKIRQSELELKESISATRADILKWVIGTIGLQTLVVLGTVLTLVKSFH